MAGGQRGCAKLLLTFEPGPGTMMGPDIVDWCAANMANLDIERSAAIAGHHTPEDQPQVIATAITAWAKWLDLR